jgi:hypothetical protein
VFPAYHATTNKSFVFSLVKGHRAFPSHADEVLRAILMTCEFPKNCGAASLKIWSASFRNGREFQNRACELALFFGLAVA